MYSSDDFTDQEPQNAAAEIPAGPLAYVRPVITDKGRAYGVFSVDGTRLAMFNSQDEALIAARQHDLEPVLLH